MNENILPLAILVIALIALAFFYNTSSSVTSPLSAPPNPGAEFGIVRRNTRAFLRQSKAPEKSPEQQKPSPTPPMEDLALRDELLKKAFSISARNARSRKPDEEYVQILYNPKGEESVNISDWKISNSRGAEYKIGRVTNFPGLSSITNQDQLVLTKGSRVNIVTGRSPRGENFRLNKCAEYFKQYDTFVPGFSVNCPSPSREPGQDALSDRCFQYVRGLSSCRIPQTLPPDIGNQCREWIQENASYSACIDAHRADKDFFKNEWYVYLNRPDQIWSDVRDTIYLTNERGTVIATQSYQ